MILMVLPDRERQVVHQVARFQQLTAGQLHDLVFFERASRTPCNRALKRLCATGYLTKVELRRLVGGSRGGAGQYVYQLGRRGYQLHFDGVYRQSRNVNYHNLLLADSYIEVVKLSRKGSLSVDVVATGDDAGLKLPAFELRPDMRLDVTRTDTKRFLMWVEVDMATEGRRQIRDKIGRYWTVVNSPHPELHEIPRCVWVACDDERAKELRWIIDQSSDEHLKAYFKVTTLEGIQPMLLG